MVNICLNCANRDICKYREGVEAQYETWNAAIKEKETAAVKEFNSIGMTKATVSKTAVIGSLSKASVVNTSQAENSIVDCEMTCQYYQTKEFLNYLQTGLRPPATPISGKFSAEEE